MKNYLMIGLLLILSSCGGMTRTMTGATENDMLKAVAIEQSCDKENIKILEKNKTGGSSVYALNVCGEKMVYKQIGSTFQKLDNGN